VCLTCRRPDTTKQGTVSLWSGADRCIIGGKAGKTHVSQLVCQFIKLTARVTFDFDQCQLLGPLMGSGFLGLREDDVKVYTFTWIWQKSDFLHFFRIMRRAGQLMNISSGTAPLRCNFAFWRKCKSPTASALNQAKGPPAGVEKSSRNSDAHTGICGSQGSTVSLSVSTGSRISGSFEAVPG
jgi:hypothetical protein